MMTQPASAVLRKVRAPLITPTWWPSEWKITTQWTVTDRGETASITISDMRTDEQLYCRVRQVGPFDTYEEVRDDLLVNVPVPQRLW